MVSISWAQALAWRMQRHLLEPVGPVSTPEVVLRPGAVLATDEGAAGLAVWARCGQPQANQFEQALVDGTVIKVFAFRCAVHSGSSELKHAPATRPTAQRGNSQDPRIARRPSPDGDVVLLRVETRSRCRRPNDSVEGPDANARSLQSLLPDRRTLDRNTQVTTRLTADAPYVPPGADSH